MKKREELPDYTVADMDLDGMPWKSRKAWHAAGDGEKKKRTFYGEHGDRAENRDGKSPIETATDIMTPEERRYMAWQGLKAALLVGLIFVGAAFLFLLFCLYIWF